MWAVVLVVAAEQAVDSVEGLGMVVALEVAEVLVEEAA